MKKTIFAVACILALSTAMASAQPSQAQGGGQTGPAGNSGMSSGSMSNGNMTSGSGMSNSSTGNSGMSESMAKDKDGMARNPSSQGNVGPGTTPGNPGSR